MPTYSYGCAACGHTFDAFQKFADAPLTDCPECSGAIRRLIHPTPIVFKGSGWYITDSKNGKATAEAKPKEGEAKTDAKTEAKGDADKAEKPAAKKDAAEKPAAKPAPVAASAD